MGKFLGIFLVAAICFAKSSAFASGSWDLTCTDASKLAVSMQIDMASDEPVPAEAAPAGEVEVNLRNAQVGTLFPKGQSDTNQVEFGTINFVKVKGKDDRVPRTLAISMVTADGSFLRITAKNPNVRAKKEVLNGTMTLILRESDETLTKTNSLKFKKLRNRKAVPVTCAIDFE